MDGVDWKALVLIGIVGGIALPLFHLFDKAKRRIGVLEDALRRIQAQGTAGYSPMTADPERFRRYVVEVAAATLEERREVSQ